MYLQRFHDVSISVSGVWCILHRLDMGRCRPPSATSGTTAAESADKKLPRRERLWGQDGCMQRTWVVLVGVGGLVAGQVGHGVRVFGWSWGSSSWSRVGAVGGGVGVGWRWCIGTVWQSGSVAVVRRDEAINYR
jgi:hypothetical protein